MSSPFLGASKQYTLPFATLPYVFDEQPIYFGVKAKHTALLSHCLMRLMSSPFILASKQNTLPSVTLPYVFDEQPIYCGVKAKHTTFVVHTELG
jgi:hypothetical protein